MRPLLACNAPENLNTLPYPVFSSEKLDGIRCIIKDGVAYSRTLKPIRNAYIQATLGRPEFNGFDGELVVGDPNASDCMRRTNSGVMSADGEPDFVYWTFDLWNRPGIQYQHALESLIERVSDHPHIKVLHQRICKTSACVEAHERAALDDGYEGLIVRRIDGAYKFGRSTKREGYLLKVKRYRQDEAVIVDYQPWFRNENDPELDALGYTKRSSAREGKVALDMLGALVVEGWHPYSAHERIEFNIGTGFTINERRLLWEMRESLIGKTITYKFFPTGSKDRPRHPVFVSFRDPSDM